MGDKLVPGSENYRLLKEPYDIHFKMHVTFIKKNENYLNSNDSSGTNSSISTGTCTTIRCLLWLSNSLWDNHRRMTCWGPGLDLICTTKLVLKSIINCYCYLKWKLLWQGLVKRGGAFSTAMATISLGWRSWNHKWHCTHSVVSYGVFSV